MSNSTASSAVPRCTAQRYDGAFCDNASADAMPFPICSHHAMKIFTEMSDRLAEVKRDPMRLLMAGFDEIETNRRRAARVKAPTVIYYVQVGDVVKIGVTSDLPTRLRAYPPHRKLLAYEPDTGGVEKRRHAEFAEYLHSGNEWFTLGPRLAKHIEGLRATARV